MSADDERLARVALNAVGEPGDLRLCRLVDELGGIRVWQSLREQQGALGDELAARVEALQPDGLLERAQRRGLRFVVPADEEWPAGLADLAHAAPLHQRGGPPIGLWVRGARRLDECTLPSVAVVGSRSATTYGDSVAGEIAATVAEGGFGVISGAAFGIDHAAHRGALAVRRTTVAVLACGADRVYPAAHRKLIDYIADTGAVVSESALGGAPMRIRFLARNRLIAALSLGTVVVEAARRSGALNTASWAGGLGRVLMGVPGPVTSAPSAGVHQLIRHRDALLVTGGAEVLEAVVPIGAAAQAEPRADPGAGDRLSAVERQALDGVPLRTPAPIARVARTAGLTEVQVGEALAVLRTAGLVEEYDGCWRLRAPD